MRKIDINELKQLQLNILDVVVSFCEENHINYWLEFGSLIGAVRHKGYIPWDDDLDIGMLRKDYNLFAEKFNSYSDRYQFHDSSNDLNYNLFFGKIFDLKTLEKDPNLKDLSHVNIDVFVFDEIDESNVKQEKMFYKRDLFRKLSNLQMLNNSSNKKVLRKFLKLLLSVFPKNFFTKKYLKILCNKKNKSSVVGNYSGYSRYTFEKKLVENTIKVPFEDREFRIPCGYDEILTKCYGNYMELPPEEKRVCPHESFEAYFLED